MESFEKLRDWRELLRALGAISGCSGSSRSMPRWTAPAGPCPEPHFGGPDRVLKYLARCTHRVAISNPRLQRLEGDTVVFTVKDRSTGNECEDRLEAVEFLRRFAQYMLPQGFVRLRPYGLLAHGCRGKDLAHCRAVLGAPALDPWSSMDWRSVDKELWRLQVRIAKAVREKRWGKVRALQRLLIRSRAAKLWAVRRVTTNKGKRTKVSTALSGVRPARSWPPSW